MLTWDEYGIAKARLAAEKSKDPSTKVGAVLVDANNCTVSDGFNGFPRGTDDSPDIYADRPEKYRRIVHAELNALLLARRQGRTLYCTHHPCSKCMGAAIQHGVKRVVYCTQINENWNEEIASAKQLAKEAGVEIVWFPIT